MTASFNTGFDKLSLKKGKYSGAHPLYKKHVQLLKDPQSLSRLTTSYEKASYGDSNLGACSQWTPSW